ncbi:MAG TPA: hypothetical protein VIK99_10690 [Thermaerobacter sp.]
MARLEWVGPPAKLRDGIFRTIEQELDPAPVAIHETSSPWTSGIGRHKLLITVALPEGASVAALAGIILTQGGLVALQGVAVLTRSLLTLGDRATTIAHAVRLALASMPLAVPTLAMAVLLGHHWRDTTTQKEDAR